MTILSMGEELSELRSVIWDVLGDVSPIDHVQRVVDGGSGVDPAVDAALAELGMYGVDVPEELGGGGGSVVHLCQVAEGCGWSAATTRLVGTAAVAGALAVVDAPNARALLTALAGGESAAAAVLPGHFAGSGGDAVLASEGSEGMRLDGRASHVLDAITADTLVTLASTEDGPVLALVRGDASGLTVERQETVDVTRSLARVVFDQVVVSEGDVIARGDDATAVAAQVVRRAALLIAGDSIGVASRVLETTTEYAKQRTQFGRAIGSFQAVKHQAADMLARTELARALVDEAASALDADRADADLLVSMAKDLACSTAAWVAGRGIQLHGGIGYTWEHEMHIYFKRAKLAEALFGDRRWHRGRITRLLRARETGN